MIKYFDFIFRVLPASIRFNFKYLPLRQAYRLPVLLYKAKLLDIKGRIIIDTADITFGMIRLGFNLASLYRNGGITWESHGGTVIFKGFCNIGNDSVISVGEKGRLIFGADFNATSAFKCVCYHSVTFGEQVCFSWENMISDTDFHSLTFLKGGRTKGYAAITIGANNWFGLRSLVLKGTETPDFFIAGANSVLNKKYSDSYCLFAGNPAVLKMKGIYRNALDDKIVYTD